MLPRPTEDAKKAIWQAYQSRKPIRVPLRWNVNVRIVILNPELNPEGYTFSGYVSDPEVNIGSKLLFQDYLSGTLCRYSDAPSAYPETIYIGADVQNAVDGAYFGGKVVCHEGQVPGSEPIYTYDDADEFLKRDYSDVLNNPFIKDRLAFTEELKKAAKGRTHRGARIEVVPVECGCDGAVTAAASIFGADFFALIAGEPEKAVAILEKLTRDMIHRNQVLLRLAGKPIKQKWGGMADDSIQLISPEMYEQYVLPLHALYYDEMSENKASDKNRFIHLCGDATRHFKMIRDRLGVYSFDTGFPVDHGQLRKELGPDVELSGGPHIGLIQGGKPSECYAEAKRILLSGVKEGGRFILQEGNNLPPCVPLENLDAIYDACLEFGKY